MATGALILRRSTLADWLELTKPRITALVTFTALVGFLLGATAPVSVAALLSALSGTALVAAGAAVFNQILERDLDARMRRTRARPLPAGRVRPAEAGAIGSVLTAFGLLLLLWRSGPLAAAVASVTWASYLFVYTPLKRRTSLATLIGAVPGALPPVIGWAAARHSLEGGAALLFAILFFWQVPHFLAIAWLYREDYERAGLPMLAVLDRDGGLTGRQAALHSLALLLVSLAPGPAGLGGSAYLAGAFLLGTALTFFALRLARHRDATAARALFLASVLYLPALLTLLLAARP
jgi:protoheme IX farnesyltransferase